jgi:hypothetical protein
VTEGAADVEESKRKEELEGEKKDVPEKWEGRKMENDGFTNWFAIFR